jgi:hypothetical protein
VHPPIIPGEDGVCAKDLTEKPAGFYRLLMGSRGVVVAMDVAEKEKEQSNSSTQRMAHRGQFISGESAIHAFIARIVCHYDSFN